MKSLIVQVSSHGTLLDLAPKVNVIIGVVRFMGKVTRMFEQQISYKRI
jgi:hypothetical protein